MSTTTATTTSTATESSPSPATRVTLSTSQPTASPSKATPDSQSNSQSQEQKEGQDEEDIYDEIEIEDMTFDPALDIYHYPCPCGDRFEISLQDLREGRTDIAVCPGCNLRIRVIYEVEDLPAEGEKAEEG